MLSTAPPTRRARQSAAAPSPTHRPAIHVRPRRGPLGPPSKSVVGEEALEDADAVHVQLHVRHVPPATRCQRPDLRAAGARLEGLRRGAAHRLVGATRSRLLSRPGPK